MLLYFQIMNTFYKKTYTFPVRLFPKSWVAGFCSLIMFCCTTASAQSGCDCFDRLYNLSYHFLKLGNKNLAVEAFKDAMSFIKDSGKIGGYYSELGDIYLSFNDTSSAIENFSKGIKMGSLENLDYVKQNNPDIFKKMDTNKLKKYDLEYKKKIDFNLYNKYISAYTLDQSVRDGTIFPEFVTGISDSLKDIFINIACNRVDSINYSFLMDVLHQYGIPWYNKVNFGFNYVLFALHITAEDDEHSRLLLQYLRDLNNSCDYILKSQILFFMERQKFFHNQKTRAGLLGRKNKYIAIEDIHKADSIRFSYNQIRIKEEASPRDSIPKEYKPIPYPKNYFCLKKYHFD